MRMWIGCLAAYNSGRLFGRWHDISTDRDENAEAITSTLGASPVRGAEEYAIMDYEAPRALVNLLGENPGSDALAWAAILVESVAERFPDEDDCAAVLSVMLDGERIADLETLAADAAERMNERIAGEGDTLAGWCADYLDETGFFDAPPRCDSGASSEEKQAMQARWEDIQRYFDHESYARDMQASGRIATERANGRLLVFWRN